MGRLIDDATSMNDIRMDYRQFTLFELNRLFHAPQRRIVLESDFQRYNAWSENQKSELIESVLMGLPLSNFIFVQDKFGMLSVVDGRQRLTALFSYMNDGFALSGLKLLPEAQNKKFSQLSPVLQNRIEGYKVLAIVVLPPTEDRVIFDIFDRLNRAGKKLTRQDIRMAQYRGEATGLLKRLASSAEFEEATGGAFIKDKRGRAEYFLTRAVALYLYKMQDLGDKTYQYRGNIDELLGKGLDALNHMDEQGVREFEQIVLENLRKSVFYLGTDAFRLKKQGRKLPVNMNVFETVLYLLMFVPSGREDIREKVKSDVEYFLNSSEFRENIRNHSDSAAKLSWRLEAAEKLGRSLS